MPGLIPSRFLSSLRDVSTSGNVDKVQAFLDDFMMEGFAASQVNTLIYIISLICIGIYLY